MSLVWDWMQHCCTARNSREKKDFIPACLESLGLMQRTYDGSLDMRISMSLARLALNWVAAWGGRHQDARVRNGETVRRRAAEPRGARDDGWRDWLPSGGWTLVPVWRTGNLRQSPVQVACVHVCVWVRVCERRACKSHGIPQWVGISRDSPSGCPLRGSWEGNTLQSSVSGETAGFHSSHTHTFRQHRASHRLRSLLVAQLLLVETLPQDLVLRHAHHLQTQTHVTEHSRPPESPTEGEDVWKSPPSSSWRAGRCSCPRILPRRREKQNRIYFFQTWQERDGVACRWLDPVCIRDSSFPN